MLEDVNVLEMRVYDEKIVVYVFCKFDLVLNGEIVFGIIKDLDISKEYKVFIYNDGIEIIFCLKIVNGREIN